VRAGILDNDGGGDEFLVDLRVVRVLAHLRSTKALAAGVRPGVVAACGVGDASGKDTPQRENASWANDAPPPKGKFLEDGGVAELGNKQALQSHWTLAYDTAQGFLFLLGRKPWPSVRGAADGVSATGSRAGEEILDIGVQARTRR
jgi:hypothetical protein